MVFFSQKTSLLLVPIFSPMFFAFPDDASPATRHARVAKCGKTNKRIRVVRGSSDESPSSFRGRRGSSSSRVISRKISDHPFSFPFFSFLSLGFRWRGKKDFLGREPRRICVRDDGDALVPRTRGDEERERRVRRDDSFRDVVVAVVVARVKQQYSNMKRASVDVDETNVGGRRPRARTGPSAER